LHGGIENLGFEGFGFEKLTGHREWSGGDGGVSILGGAAGEGVPDEASAGAIAAEYRGNFSGGGRSRAGLSAKSRS